MVANVSWREDLEAWLAPFLADLTHPAQRRMRPAYIAGLIGPGERRMSYRAAAVRFGVAAAMVIRWHDQRRSTGT